MYVSFGSGTGQPRETASLQQHCAHAHTCTRTYLQGFATHFAENLEHYKGLFDSNDAHEVPLAKPWEDVLTPFQKICFLRCVRLEGVPLHAPPTVIQRESVQSRGYLRAAGRKGDEMWLSPRVLCTEVACIPLKAKSKIQRFLSMVASALGR